MMEAMTSVATFMCDLRCKVTRAQILSQVAHQGKARLSLPLDPFPLGRVGKKKAGPEGPGLR